MCGLVVARDANLAALGVEHLDHRGPDRAAIVEVDGWHLGHTRLSVVDLTSAADQPMTRGSVTAIYNGEMWNHDNLASGFNLVGTGDTEAVVNMLNAHGVDALARFDGQYAIAWVDTTDGLLRVARDPVGEVPLHYGYHSTSRALLVASEIKALLEMGAHPSTVEWVPPGSVATWEDAQQLPHIDTIRTFGICQDETVSRDDAAEIVDQLLHDAVAKRSTVADVPVAALLSGGIDSSAVAWHALPYLPNLVGYTAVYDPDSLDRRCAHLVAESLGIDLVEVIVPPPSADDLASTVAAIEMPHKAQVEIGWACLHLARRLHDDGVRVVLSGEGSDELWASYGRSYHQEQKHGWAPSRLKQVVNQHRKNYARVNKVFMAHSVEGRLPFADAALVEYGLTLPRDVVFGPPWSCQNGSVGQREARNEKMVLRQSYLDRLPERIVKRDKAAFQSDAGLPDACAAAVANPQGFYRHEFRRRFAGVNP